MKCKRILLLVQALNLIYLLVFIITGFCVDSLTLVGNTFDILPFALAVSVSYVGIKFTALDSKDYFYCYGWRMATVLSGAVNSVVYLTLGFTLAVDALDRLYNPIPIQVPAITAIVSGLAVILVILQLILLRRHLPFMNTKQLGKCRDMNMESVALLAYAYLSTSLIQCALSGLHLLMANQKLGLVTRVADALLSLALAVYILVSAKSILFRCTQSLLLSNSFEGHATLNKIKKVEGVAVVSELHVWNLNESEIVASVHLQSHDDQNETIVHNVRKILMDHGIQHSTIELKRVDAFSVCIDECKEPSCFDSPSKSENISNV